MASQNLPRKSKKQRSPWIRRLKQGLVLFLTFCLIAFSTLGFFYFNAKRDAEEAMKTDLHGIIEKGINKPTTKILSRDGIVLLTYSKENRVLLKLSEIPKFVQNAVVAAEDKRFYQHQGVDLTAMARIVLVDLRGGRLAQGGSTITMQLVKLLFNGSSRSFRRKMNDIAYAQVMEQKIPKDQILELYLNKVFFGEGAYGIGEAAKVYFNKSIDQLTLGEAAMLARCIRRPSIENPIRDIETSIQNRNVVLKIMLDENMITDEEYNKAVDEKPHINPKQSRTGAHVRPGAEYFVRHVQRFLEKDLGLDLINGGYTIETSLDFGIQRKALNTVQSFIDANREDLRINQGAFLAMDSDGFILAEVGGLNYAEHQTNLITDSLLQPGSGFKPFLYATALKDGIITMDSNLSNEAITEINKETGKVWKPGNASKNENQKSYSVRSALALSVNLPAIHLMHDVTPVRVVQEAYDSFGFHSKLEPYLPLALGASGVTPLEIAEGYSVFMLHGDRVHPQPVLRVLDSDGTVVKKYEPQRYPGVFDAHIADEVDELLLGVVERGTGTAAQKVPNARGKTGTTNEAKDAWFTGYSDGVLGVSWVGHEVLSKKGWIRTPMNQRVYGGSTAGKIWAEIMTMVHDKYAKTATGQPAPIPIRVKPKEPDAAPDVDPDLVAMPGDSNLDAAVGGDPNQATDPKPGTDGSDNSGPIKPVVPGKVSPADGTDASPTQAKTDAPTTVRTKKDKKAGDESNSDTVSVEICEDSGQIANPYCNETVTRTYKRGTEPKRKCTIHGAGQ